MRITIHIPNNLGPRLKQAASKEGMSVSAFTAKALEEYLKGKRKRDSGNHLLQLIRPGSVSPDAWEELEKDRADNRD
ncbi:MAG: CopG family transcriptional regulator [Thermodesulfobacteriota bacterium]